MKLGIVTVPGINTKPKYFVPFQKHIQAMVEEDAQLLADPSEGFDSVAFASAYWPGFLEETQRRLWPSFKKLPMRWLRWPLVHLMSDISLYLGSKDAYQSIHKTIEDGISELDDCDYYVIVAHSLGTVIASNFVWDTPNEDRLLGLYMMGSPLAVFWWPERVSMNTFRNWHHIYDRHDPLAYPLSNVRAYATRIQEIEVETGWILSHNRYWRSEYIANYILSDTIAAMKHVAGPSLASAKQSPA